MNKLTGAGVVALCIVLVLGACTPRKRPASLDVQDEQVSDLPRQSEPGEGAFSVLRMAYAYGRPVYEPMSSDVGDFDIPAELAITRPAEEIETGADVNSYFIMGTSDPAQPLYFEGEEVERLGTQGTFGIHVELLKGVNTFSVTQGDKTETAVIRRKTDDKPEPISELRPSSLVPAEFSAVEAGDRLDVGCIAPSGAEVTASFGGATVRLEQASPADDGTPATFLGTLNVGADYPEGVTTEVGPVTYSMNYQGTASSGESAGVVYVAGRGSSPAVQVDGYFGFVYPDLSDLSLFKESVKGGAVDYVREESNKYLRLSSGGYIPKEMVSVIEGNPQVQNTLSRVDTTLYSREEIYTFVGDSCPFYDTKILDNTFSLTLYNTSGAPEVDVSQSRLISSVQVREEEGAVTYSMPLKGRVWGYNVAFDGTNTVVTMKYKPMLRQGTAPLRGVTVVLDPGHGGDDNGALGLAGEDGATEKDLNFAHALVTRDLLASMGAKVVLTRSEDVRVSLDERVQIFEESGGDFFVSIHHNSVAESTDSNTVSGMEIYYHTGLSGQAGEDMMHSLETALGRKNRKVEQSYYRVTLIPYAPSMLVELGFMSNPLEYERAATRSEMDRVAAAIADGICATLD